LVGRAVLGLLEPVQGMCPEKLSVIRGNQAKRKRSLQRIYAMEVVRHPDG